MTLADHPPGTIGVIAGHNARYTAFSQALMATQTPRGSSVFWAIGLDYVHGCNSMVEHLHGEWLWILGDDHVWDPGLLERLLDHQLPVVAPLVARRQAPFLPVVFEHQVGGPDSERYQIIDLEGRSGLAEVEAVGSAGLLVRYEVLEAIDPPWFALKLGDSQKMSEDVYFCQQIRKAGYPIHVDLDAPMGHLFAATIALGPNEDGVWHYRFDLGEGSFVVPMPPNAVSPHRHAETADG